MLPGFWTGSTFGASGKSNCNKFTQKCVQLSQCHVTGGDAQKDVDKMEQPDLVGRYQCRVRNGRVS